MNSWRSLLLGTSVAVVLCAAVTVPSDTPQAMHAVPRSPHWPAVRRAHLLKEPFCQVCGTTDDLEVHHVLDFARHPERECDPDNLITLCRKPGHNCHFCAGHLYSYKRSNVHIREDAKRTQDRIEEAKRNQP